MIDNPKPRPILPSPSLSQSPLSRRPLVAGIVIALLVLLFTKSTVQAAFTLTTAAIGGQTTVTVYAGGTVTVDVTASRNFSTDYDGTSYRWGTSDSFTCVNTPDNTLGDEGVATDTESIDVVVPLTPGTYTLQVQAHSQSDCGGEVGEIVSLTIIVIAGATNADLVPACGLDVILVLDESFSIHVAGATANVRTAANAFLAGLNNTGSRIAIIEFNRQARQVNGYIEVNPANLPSLQDYINDVGSPPQGGYNPAEYAGDEGSTNWDDAFAKVADRNAAGGVAPLVVFITDGEPTTHSDGAVVDGGGDYPANDPRMVKAIEGANEVKAQGSHFLAVGVGNSLNNAESQARLQLISGPQLYQGAGVFDIAATDLFLVSDFANLMNALQQIATALCQSSVTITKLVDHGNAQYVLGPGWQFSASARYQQPSGTDFAWTLPNTTTNPAAVISGATDASGRLTFQWDPNGSQGASSIAITETVQPGYKFESVLCTKTSGGGAITVTPAGNAFSITGIAIDAIVACEVKNKLILADLELNKEINNGTADVGSQVIFTVDVFNRGPDLGTGIKVSDTLPSGYTYLSDDSGGAYNSTTKIWDIGNLAVNDTTTLKITARVNASGIYTNYAQVWFANEEDIDSTPGNNSTTEDDDDTAVTTLTPIADLELGKNVNNSTPLIGSQVIFTVIVTNTGPSNATGVRVRDQLPSGYTYLSDDSGGKYDSTTGIWEVGNLAVGASASIKFTVRVNDTGDYLNYAQVWTANEKDIDSTPGNNSTSEDDDDTEPTTPVRIVDLELDKSVNNNTPEVGDQIIFTIIVTNKGPDNATFVTVSDKLPSGYTYVSDDSGGKYDNTTGIWQIGALAIGNSATLKITVTVNASGQFLNYAQVETSNEPDPDSTPGNDSDEEDDDDTESVTVRASIGDRVWVDENKNGIQDLGEPGAADVKVDLFKADGTFVANAGQSAADTLVATTRTNATGGYLFTNLEPGNYYVAYTAPPGFSFTRYDVNGNSQDTVDSDPVVPLVQVSVTDHNVNGIFGTNLLYTIFYTNTDPSQEASNLLITPSVPAGTTFVSANSSVGWNCTDFNAGGVCTFSLPTLAPKASGSLTFVVRLKGSDAEVPDLIDLLLGLVHTTNPHTLVLTLVAGEDNRTVDAGLIRTAVAATEQTATPTGPTNLPESEQPSQRQFIFLPTVESQE